MLSEVPYIKILNPAVIRCLVGGTFEKVSYWPAFNSWSGPTFQPLAPAGTVPCRKSLRPASGVGTCREGAKAIGNSLCRGQCRLHHLFVVSDFTLHARSLRPQCFLH